MQKVNKAKQEACLARKNREWLASITTPVSLLTNQCDVGSVLRGQVSLTAVNHIPVLSCGYEQVKKKIKIH